MATIVAAWVQSIASRVAATIAAGATEVIDVDLATAGYDLFELQLDIVIGSASSVTVSVYGSADTGTTDDITALQTYSVIANDRRTLFLSGAHRQVSITNDDGSNATGNISALGAGRSWFST